MSKVNIVYIGPKKSKRDTICGTRQVFPQYKAIPVEEEHAANLLRFPTVFVEESELEGVLKQKEAIAELKAEAEKRAEEQEKAEKEKLDLTVTVDGTKYDLNKMSSPKIAALIEGADLEIEAKGSQEPVPDFKLRVRNAIRELDAE